MSYLVVSLDGGGIRGILSAKLLQRLHAARPFIDAVELVAGTSTGGILALALADGGFSPEQLVSLYVDHGETIFSTRDLLDRLSGPADEWARADYDNVGDTADGRLDAILRQNFGDKKLEDLSKKVLIPTFDLDNGKSPPDIRHWKPKFFHNYATPGNDGDQSVVDVALRTTAAPTFFPSHQGYIDGGVVANNPSTCAVAKAIKAGIDIADIHLLSVGTGSNPHVIRGDRLDWGKSQWALRIIQVMMDGVPGVSDYQCRQLLGDRYHRLDVQLTQPIGLDEVARVDTLLKYAEAAPVNQALEWLQGVS